MTTFLTYFMDSKRSKCGSGILEIHFFCFSKFWLRTKICVFFNIFMSQCSIFIFAFIILYFFSLLSPWPAESKSVQIFWYHHRFSSYGKTSLIFFNSAFYSVRALFKMMQLFSTSLTIKFDPDEIETYCFLLLKAEIQAIIALKLYSDW
jgi:hypothetical protein